MRLIQYNSQKYTDISGKDVAALTTTIDNDCINWIDVEAAEEQVVKQIAAYFCLHEMIIEDILIQDHLPKLEIFENHLFFTLRMLYYNSKDEELNEEQLSIVLGENYVLSFQSGIEGDVFDNILADLKLGKGIIRKEKTDYLFYRILDAVIDEYFNILELLREQIETLEEFILSTPHPSEATVGQILELRKKITLVRKYTIPLKDIVSKLKTADSKFINPGTITFLQDISDQLLLLNTNFETFREMLKDLMELYLANLSHNLNRVMKTLTIVATIFIPLTFVAGIYGMNFENMPELHWKYGYFIIWGIMLLLALLMVYYMKKMHWFE
ncbi:magnesium and cobalt transport protein CorA [Sphingobacteriales bacterium UPWRP_1]|nr:magnesium and cobalt transport protein CorA [Sphingobacteriales bacterium TSM_CSS]PSJ78689.1 magnesium and cobalt transport protein CorA [Sphingobacteriales bacterium UPWRP_1]